MIKAIHEQKNTEGKTVFVLVDHNGQPIREYAHKRSAVRAYRRQSVKVATAILASVDLDSLTEGDDLESFDLEAYEPIDPLVIEIENVDSVPSELIEIGARFDVRGDRAGYWLDSDYLGSNPGEALATLGG